MLPSAIGRSHLTRLVLIALELQRQGAKVAFAFKESNQILEHYQFQVFPVSDAVKRRL
jgi:UDP:flavonoid glycosyltransferase YjiC (YdhE family)